MLAARRLTHRLSTLELPRLRISPEASQVSAGSTASSNAEAFHKEAKAFFRHDCSSGKHRQIPLSLSGTGFAHGTLIRSVAVELDRMTRVAPRAGSNERGNYEGTSCGGRLDSRSLGCGRDASRGRSDFHKPERDVRDLVRERTSIRGGPRRIRNVEEASLAVKGLFGPAWHLATITGAQEQSFVSSLALSGVEYLAGRSSSAVHGAGWCGMELGDE